MEDGDRFSGDDLHPTVGRRDIDDITLIDRAQNGRNVIVAMERDRILIVVQRAAPNRLMVSP